MEFLFYYHYFSGWLLKYIYHFYLFIFIFYFYFCIIFLHTNLPCFVKRPRAIVIDWALYKYFYYYYYKRPDGVETKPESLEMDENCSTVEAKKHEM